MTAAANAVNSQLPQSTLKSAFLHDCVRVPLDHLLPLKILRAAVKSSHKYHQILASVREVGLVEAPVVVPVPRQNNRYYLLDGHLRVEALKDLGATDVECIVATDDDTYTYNKRINRLSAVQDHRMIVKAMEHGASAERIGKSLGLSAQTILHRFRLLNGICDEAIGLLADKPCPGKVFDILRQMKPLRQIEAAELMTGHKNYAVMFANAILAATKPAQLIASSKAASDDHVTVDSMARMERELASLQMQIKGVEDTYGPDVLHLTVVRGYLAKLLANAPTVRWLAKYHPEYLKEFQNLTDMTQLPGEDTGAH